MISILANLTEDDINEYPFPHIVKRDILDVSLLNDLIGNFPELEDFPDFSHENNVRLSFRYSNYLQSRVVSPTWKEFLKKNSDREHLQHFIRIFGKHIKTLHPYGHQFLEYLQNTKIGTQGIDSFSDAPILLHSAIDANTPNSKGPSSVRGPHLDSARSLWVGLFYLRDENESKGGDLVLYERIPDGNPTNAEGPIADSRKAREPLLKAFKTVKYEANSLFLGLNTKDTIHGVSPRSPTHHARKFSTFNCHLQHPTFDWKP